MAKTWDNEGNTEGKKSTSRMAAGSGSGHMEAPPAVPGSARSGKPREIAADEGFVVGLLPGSDAKSKKSQKA